MTERQAPRLRSSGVRQVPHVLQRDQTLFTRRLPLTEPCGLCMRRSTPKPDSAGQELRQLCDEILYSQTNVIAQLVAVAYNHMIAQLVAVAHNHMIAAQLVAVAHNHMIAAQLVAEAHNNMIAQLVAVAHNHMIAQLVAEAHNNMIAQLVAVAHNHMIAQLVAVAHNHVTAQSYHCYCSVLSAELHCNLHTFTRPLLDSLLDSKY